MAVIPKGAQELSYEDALRYHRSWTSEDRNRVRQGIEEHHFHGAPEFYAPFLRWYVPPSGGYVAGHIGKRDRPTTSQQRHGIEAATNDLVLYPGYVVLAANSPAPIRLELSAARMTGVLARSSVRPDPPVCADCFLAHAGPCH